MCSPDTGESGARARLAFRTFVRCHFLVAIDQAEMRLTITANPESIGPCRAAVAPCYMGEQHSGERRHRKCRPVRKRSRTAQRRGSNGRQSVRRVRGVTLTRRKSPTSRPPATIGPSNLCKRASRVRANTPAETGSHRESADDRDSCHRWISPAAAACPSARSTALG